MVDKKNCNFCGQAIEPGTGKMYVKRDGSIYNLCSNKCKKNLIDLKRVPRRTRWTKRYAELKESALKHEKAMSEKDEDTKPDVKKKPVKRPVPVKKQAEEAPPKKAGETTKEEEKTAVVKKPVKRPVPVKKQAEEKPDTPEKNGE